MRSITRPFCQPTALQWPRLFCHPHPSHTAPLCRKYKKMYTICSSPCPMVILSPTSLDGWNCTPINSSLVRMHKHKIIKMYKRCLNATPDILSSSALLVEYGTKSPGIRWRNYVLQQGFVIIEHNL